MFDRSPSVPTVALGLFLALAAGAVAHDVAAPKGDPGDVAVPSTLSGAGLGKIVLPGQKPGRLLAELRDEAGTARYLLVAEMFEIPLPAGNTNRRGFINGDLLRFQTGELVGEVDGLWHEAQGEGQLGLSVHAVPGVDPIGTDAGVIDAIFQVDEAEPKSGLGADKGPTADEGRARLAWELFQPL